MIAIVGGGLAGYSLAKTLYERGYSFVLYDNSLPSASHISSGVINPITGRRYALAWRFEELKNAALDFYGDYISQIPILRCYRPYNESSTIEKDLEGKEAWASIEDNHWVHIHQGYQVRISAFLTEWTSRFQALDYVQFESFDYSQMQFDSSEIGYNGSRFQSIIFAEGIGIRDNPFFNALPHQPNRGEALRIQLSESKLDKIIQKGKFICPFQDDYWVGSTFERVQSVDTPRTEAAYQSIASHIPDLVDGKDYKIVEHLGAFRVTIPDRRPIIGVHPRHPNLFLFNGFGTKGASLIPYFAAHVVDVMMGKASLIPEVDLARFKGLD